MIFSTESERWTRRSLTTLCALALAGLASAQYKYTITELNGVQPFRINSHGQVAGHRVIGEDGNGQPIFQGAMWTPSSANGTTGSANALDMLHAFDINDFGQIAGVRRGATTDPDGFAVLWTPSAANGTSGSQIDLSDGVDWSNGRIAINSEGRVAYATLDIPTIVHTAFLFVPTTPNGTTGSSTQIGNFAITAMNDYGQVSGWQYPNHYEAVLWTPDASQSLTGSLTLLGNLGEEGSDARDLNQIGQVVGWSNPGIGGAVRWDPAGPNDSSLSIIDLDETYFSSWANGIDDFGNAYGAFYTGAFDTFRAAVFLDGQIIDLNSYVPEDSGIVLAQAMDANDKGQIIVFGLLNGVQTGFLLTPKPVEEQIGDVKDLVQELVDLGALLPANGNSLFAKLNAAIAKATAGNTAGAISDLESFINQVRAFVRNGRLSTADGQKLIDAANILIAELSA
jgi:hypothetical protein